VRIRFEIDHFIPWSRYPDNGLDNLVVSDPDCNRAKRDHLASGDHVEQWLRRSEQRAQDFRAIAGRLRWEHQPERSTGVARSIYLRLPDTARLWHSGEEFVAADSSQLERLFSCHD